MSTPMLDELRVLDLGTGVSAAYASKLLGDHGADVIKVEPPEGDPSRRRGPFPGGIPDPERSGLFLATHVNKRGICLDFDLEQDRSELLRLIDWADILILDASRQRAEELGLDATSLESRRPNLVTLSITPFGVAGPYADYHASELTVSAAGGWAHLIPSATGDADLPPLKAFGHQCAFMSGLAAASIALATWSAALRDGRGEFIDFSQQSYTASALENAIPQHAYLELIATRYAPRVLIPWSIFECRDGQLFLACIEQDQWERLVSFMGHPEWATLEVFESIRDRGRNGDILHHFMQEWLADRSAIETYHALQAERVCAAPVYNMAQIADSPHLKERQAFVEIEHAGAGKMVHLAPAAKIDDERLPIRTGAPRLDEHRTEIRSESQSTRESVPREQAPSRPLEGVRIADLTWAWAGPFCTMQLAYLGAEVVRFESEGRSDVFRRLAVFPKGLPLTLNTAGMFHAYNQDKQSVSLNLAEPRAREILHEYIDTCDVVVENFATGVMDRLGLGYETLAARNPGLIMASISAYGETGPYREYMGYGPAVGPLTGLSAATGFVDGPPTELGVAIADPNAGITAAFEVTAALAKRRLNGKGCHLDISLWEATAAFSIEAWMDFAMNQAEPVRQGSRDPWMSPHGFFRTSGDDDWISIACASDEDWRSLCDELEPALASDARFATLSDRKQNEAELEAEISRSTLGRERWELTRALQKRGVAAFPSMSAKDLVEDAHLEARGLVERLPHPAVGARAVMGMPYRLRNRPNGVRQAAPILGVDTDEVLGKMGYSTSEIATLRESNVLY